MGLVGPSVLLVDRLFLALRSQHMGDSIRNAARRLLEVSHLKVTQKSQCQHLPAEYDQHGGKNQKWTVVAHDRGMMDDLVKHQPKSDSQTADQRNHAYAAKQVQRTIHILQQEADSDQIKKNAEGARDAVVRRARGTHDILDGDLADGSAVPGG